MKAWDILIIDKSSSMTPNRKLIQIGYAKLIDEQIEQKSENRFTLIGFNTEVKLIKDEYFPEVSDLKDNDFFTSGCTALLDAVGVAYNLIKDDDECTNITITIITDGMENSSKEYTYKSLDDLRKELNVSKKIKMVFIGTDCSCIKQNSISNQADFAINCSGDFALAMRTASRTMSSTRDNSIENELKIQSQNSFNDETDTSLKRQTSFIVSPPKIKRSKRVVSS
jgi:hypothetical protein